MSDTSAALTFALGGGLGAVARHALALLVVGWLGRRFERGDPDGRTAGAGLSAAMLATLAVNLLGSLLLGVLVGAASAGAATGALVETLVGFTGGFTTFSSFAAQSVQPWLGPTDGAEAATARDRRASMRLASNVAANLAGCVAAFAFGVWLAGR